MPRNRKRSPSPGKKRRKNISSSGKDGKFYWHDHCSSAEWQSIADIEKWVEHTLKHPCETKGKIILETKDVIVVSAENDGNGNFGNASMIFKALLTNKGGKK